MATATNKLKVDRKKMTVEFTNKLAELRQWQSRNPLRVWRESQQPYISLQTCGSLLGTSQQAISSWECGNSWPTDHHMKNLSELLNIKQVKLEGQWELWFGEMYDEDTKQRRRAKAN
jgi:ribosome-binding protein aMBF1 (putative translation factor)